MNGGVGCFARIGAQPWPRSQLAPVMREGRASTSPATDSLCLVSHWMDWLLGQLSPSQWDSWRNWLATIGGIVALLIAALTYQRNVRNKREEQARLVYSETTQIGRFGPGTEMDAMVGGATRGAGEGITSGTNPGTYKVGGVPVLRVTVTVNNESSEVIGPVLIGLVDPMRGTRYLHARIEESSIKPKASAVYELMVIPLDEWSSAAPTVLFRDAGNNWWRRISYEPIEHVHDDPSNFPWNSPNRGPSARKSGKVWAVDDFVKTVPRLSTRWHRFWRRLRGKSPIP